MQEGRAETAMKKTFLCSLAFLLIASAASAQTFTLGGRYSSYSTDLEVGPATFETGREGSFGLVGSFRSGGLVLSGMYDVDSGGDLDIDIIPLDLAEFERSRFEGTIGYSVLPFMDIEGGVRLDNIEFGGVLFFDDDVELEHQALTAGITFHTPTIRPVGWYGTVRGYIGTADFNVQGFDAEADTTGYRLEMGVPIPLGTSAWEITPGVEYEVINTEDDDSLINLGDALDLESNRLFILFGYTFGR
jgi:hypothetical protein